MDRGIHHPRPFIALAKNVLRARWPLKERKDGTHSVPKYHDFVLNQTSLSLIKLVEKNNVYDIKLAL